MHETPEDLQRLSDLLAESIERAGPFLRESFQMPEHSMTAGQVLHLLQGLPTVSLATVTAKGEPRVAPVGALFYRGAFCIPTVMQAARARHARQRPAVSVTWYEGIDLSMIVHGTAEAIGVEHDEFAAINTAFATVSQSTPDTWGGGGPLYLRVQPNLFVTFARTPANVPDLTEPAP